MSQEYIYFIFYFEGFTLIMILNGSFEHTNHKFKYKFECLLSLLGYDAILKFEILFQNIGIINKSGTNFYVN